MPMTPFKGVRISWLMLAKNSLLALAAASAASLALARAAVALTRSVTFSWATTARAGPSPGKRVTRTWNHRFSVGEWPG